MRGGHFEIIIISTIFYLQDDLTFDLAVVSVVNQYQVVLTKIFGFALL